MLIVLTSLPGLTAQPQNNTQYSPAEKMHIFRSKSKKGRRGVISRKGCLGGQARSFFVKVWTFFATWAKNSQEGPLYLFEYER